MKKTTLLCLLMIPFLFGFKTNEDVIKIGVALAFSSGFKNLALDIKHGVELATEEWNAKGGILGKKIRLIIKDDHNDPALATTIAQDLIKQEVVGVIGHLNSGCSLPASEYYNQAKIPMISPSSTNPKLTAQGYVGVFRTCGKDDLQAKIAANFIKQFQFKTVALIHDQTVYGEWLVNEFRKQLPGKIITVYSGSFNQVQKNFKPILKELSLKQPDLIYFGGSYIDGGMLLKQAREEKINAWFMSGDAAFDHGFIGVTGTSNLHNVYFTANADINKKPSAQAFINKYTKEFGSIGEYSANAYDAANALFAAIAQAGTTSGPEIIAKLHQLEFAGALGKFKFDAAGDVNHATYTIWTIKNDRLQELTGN